MIETFIRRPVFTTMFILLLVVFGIRCYPEIGVDLNPDVDMPIVSVRVTYDGASPEEMETLITKPIENRVSQVAGYKTISSTVLEGYSETVLEALTRRLWPAKCAKRLPVCATVCRTISTNR